jgi:putative phosphoesterase
MVKESDAPARRRSGSFLPAAIELPRMHVAIVSDTHIPSRASNVPGWVEAEIRAADHTIHAGDFDAPDSYDRVRDLADGDLTAVTGNMDPAGLGLPETETVELGGVTFAVIHGTGPLHDYHDRVARTVRDAAGPDAVGVSGHTHQVLDDERDGVRLLNPGSATGAAPADEATMMVADVDDGRLDVTLRRE